MNRIKGDGAGKEIERDTHKSICDERAIIGLAQLLTIAFQLQNEVGPKAGGGVKVTASIFRDEGICLSGNS